MGRRSSLSAQPTAKSALAKAGDAARFREADATTVFKGSSNCIFNCLVKEMIQQVAAAEEVGGANMLDLADVLTTWQMDRVFGMHPNCDGHEALKAAIVDRVFQPTSIRQDVAHAEQWHSFAQEQAANECAPCCTE